MRVFLSLKWTEDFVAAALKLEKAYIPKYDVVDWVSAAVFDNYTTEQVNYSPAHNADTQGERLDMTIWVNLYLPTHVLPYINMGRLGPPGVNCCQHLNVVDALHEYDSVWFLLPSGSIQSN
eukprot:3430678-Pleurochrysis_carterae.AAC.1